MYIHDNKTKKNIIIETCLILSLFFIEGIYKNGIILYQKGLINVWKILYPLVYIAIGLGIYFLIRLILKRKLDFDYDLVHIFLVSMTIMPNTNFYVFALVIFFLSFLSQTIFKNLHYNRICLYHLVIVGILYLLHSYSYETLIEANYHFRYNFFDLLNGYQVGGLCSTNIILSIIVFFLLSLRGNVKVKTGIISIISYLLISLGICLFKGNFDLLTVFNANIIFALLFVATDALSSPNTWGGMLIYGILIGILTCLFNYLINPFEGVYLAILCCSFFLNLYEKMGELAIFTKKLQKNKGN